MGWLIALGVVLFLAMLPIGVSVRYNSDGFLAKVMAGPVRFRLYPRSKKKQKEKPKQEPEAKKPAKKKPSVSSGAQQRQRPEQTQETGGSLLDFLPLVKIALDFLADFRRKLRINQLQLKLIMAADDPCDLAVNYGRAWAALGNLMPQLEKLFVIQERDLEVECDFAASETLVIMRLDLTITLGRVIALTVGYGLQAVKAFLKIKKKRKGGAKQ